jgi:putative DNA primase/helicase
VPTGRRGGSTRRTRGQAGAGTDGGGGHSPADTPLCRLLAFWTNGDPQRVDRLFRQSGLLREKWDEVHDAAGSTDGEKTVERACRQVEDGITLQR